MKKLQMILSYARRALDDYDMIKDGDKIAVGVSAGKDSLTLLCAMAELRRFYPIKYDICVITVDIGFGNADYSCIAELCRRLGVDFHLVKSQIGPIIFDTRKESNPCSLCAKMRRGMLNEEARRHSCTRVALGHHFDDTVETFMLNLFYGGRVGCYQPVTYLSNTDLFVIRPLIYTPEKTIRQFSTQAKLPIMESRCPANGNTERESMKQLLKNLENGNKGLRKRIFGAIQRGEIDGFKPAGRLPLE